MSNLPVQLPVDIKLTLVAPRNRIANRSILLVYLQSQSERSEQSSFDIDELKEYLNNISGTRTIYQAEEIHTACSDNCTFALVKYTTPISTTIHCIFEFNNIVPSIYKVCSNAEWKYCLNLLSGFGCNGSVEEFRLSNSITGVKLVYKGNLTEYEREHELRAFLENHIKLISSNLSKFKFIIIKDISNSCNQTVVLVKCNKRVFGNIGKLEFKGIRPLKKLLCSDKTFGLQVGKIIARYPNSENELRRIGFLGNVNADVNVDVNINVSVGQMQDIQADPMNSQLLSNEPNNNNNNFRIRLKQIPFSRRIKNSMMLLVYSGIFDKSPLKKYLSKYKNTIMTNKAKSIHISCTSDNPAIHFAPSTFVLVRYSRTVMTRDHHSFSYNGVVPKVYKILNGFDWNHCLDLLIQLGNESIPRDRFKLSGNIVGLKLEYDININNSEKCNLNSFIDGQIKSKLVSFPFVICQMRIDNQCKTIVMIKTSKRLFDSTNKLRFNDAIPKKSEYKSSVAWNKQIDELCNNNPDSKVTFDNSNFRVDLATVKSNQVDSLVIGANEN